MTERITKSDIPGISWPSIRIGKNAVLTALMSELEKTQWLPTVKIEELQIQQLSVLIKHHSTNTPSFSKRLVKAKLGAKRVSSKNGLHSLPILTRRDIQNAGSTFFCRQVPKEHQPTSVSRSSGSTGEPVVVSKTAINMALFSVNMLRDHSWHKRDFSGRLSTIRASFSEPSEHPNWGSPMTDLYQTGVTQCIPVKTDVRKQIRMLEKFRPNVLITYPNNLQALCEIWAKKGFKHSTLKHIRTFGETVSDDLRGEVKNITGLPIEDNYSSQEVGIIAIQCPESGLYHVMSESLIVEILNDDNSACSTGEVGRVIVTDLHNFASPIIRYELGDYAEVGGECSCGRGLPTLRRINGRERNLVKYPDGSRRWPVWGNKQIYGFSEVRQIQLVQQAIDEIELRLVTDDELTIDQENIFIQIVQENLGYPFKVRVTQSRDNLERNESGKFEQFYCKV